MEKKLAAEAAQRERAIKKEEMQKNKEMKNRTALNRPKIPKCKYNIQYTIYNFFVIDFPVLNFLKELKNRNNLKFILKLGTTPLTVKTKMSYFSTFS